MKNNIKKITNEVSTSGQVVCPVCNRPGSWREGGRLHTSPMVRIVLANLDALVHNCCLHRLYTDINGQLVIHYRRKFLLNLLPGCWRFVSGALRLAGLMLKHGVKEGAAKYRYRKCVLGMDKDKAA
ncbi:MAG: hypothetical protein AB7V08_08715 [Elusimicrobiales bacterium]